MAMKNINVGENNGMWKGDSVGLYALHEWVWRRLPRAKLCQSCKKVPPHDLANISQEYKRDLSDWEWLCRRCHMIKDGRMKMLHVNAAKRPRKTYAYKGGALTVKEIAKSMGTTPSIIHSRLSRGTPIDAPLKRRKSRL